MKYSNKPFYQKGGVKYLSGIASKINNKQQLTEQERNDYSNNYHKLASKGVDANGEEYLNANLPEVEITAERIPYTKGLPTPYKLMSGYADMAGQVMNTPAAAMGELAHAVSGKEANLSRIVPQQLNPYSKHWQGDKGTPEQRSVSDAANIQNPVGRFAVDMATDPTTWTGAGVVKNMNKVKPQQFIDLNANVNTAVKAAQTYRKPAREYINLVSSDKSMERARLLDKEHGTKFSEVIPEWKRNLQNSDGITTAYNIKPFNQEEFVKHGDSGGFSGYTDESFNNMLSDKRKMEFENFSKTNQFRDFTLDEYLNNSKYDKLQKYDRIIRINPNASKNHTLKNTIPHELKHDLTHGNALLTDSYKESQRKFLKSREDFHKTNSEKFSGGFEDAYDYYSNPTELDAYLSTNMRQQMVDKKILTGHFDNLNEEQLDKYLKSKGKNKRAALNVIGDKPEQRKAFVEWFNKALPAAGTGVIANEALKDKKQNGGIMNHKIYNNGGVIHLPKKNKGGMVDPVSTMGYKDNSPYTNAKQLPIYSSSGAITMNGVSKPLMVKDVDNNEVRYLKPNSGVHQFKGQRFIERPMYQEGGDYESSLSPEIEAKYFATATPQSEKFNQVADATFDKEDKFKNYSNRQVTRSNTDYANPIFNDNTRALKGYEGAEKTGVQKYQAQTPFTGAPEMKESIQNRTGGGSKIGERDANSMKGRTGDLVLQQDLNNRGYIGKDGQLTDKGKGVLTTEQFVRMQALGLGVKDLLSNEDLGNEEANNIRKEWLQKGVGKERQTDSNYNVARKTMNETLEHLGKSNPSWSSLSAGEKARLSSPENKIEFMQRFGEDINKIVQNRVNHGKEAGRTSVVTATSDYDENTKNSVVTTPNIQTKPNAVQGAKQGARYADEIDYSQYNDKPKSTYTSGRGSSNNSRPSSSYRTPARRSGTPSSNRGARLNQSQVEAKGNAQGQNQQVNTKLTSGEFKPQRYQSVFKKEGGGSVMPKYQNSGTYTPQPITNYARGYANEGTPYQHYFYGNEGESVNNQGNERGKGYRTSNRNVVRQMQQDMRDYALATGNKEMLREISGVDGAYGVKTANSFKKYGHNLMKWKADNGKLTPQQQKAWEAYQGSSKAPETKSGDNPATNAGNNPNNSSSGATNKYGATTEPNLYGLQYNNPNNNQPYVFENKPMFRNTPNTNATYNSPGYFSDTRPQFEANDNAPMSNKERLRAARKERRNQIGTNVSNWIDDWRGRRADKIEIRNAMRRDKEENREGYRDAQADSNRAIVTADSDYRVQKHDYKTRGRLNKLDDETQAKLDRMTDKQNRLVVEKDAQSGRERRDYSYKPVAGSSENYAAENINNGQNQTFDNIQNKPVYTPQPIADKVNYTDRQIQPMRRVDSLPAEEQPVVEKAPAKRVDNLVENMNQPQPKSYDINESMNQMLYPKKFNGGKVKSLQVYRVGGSMVKKYDDGGNTPNYVQQMNLPEPKKFNINDMMNQTLYPAKPQPNFQQPQTEQGYYRVGDVGGARMNHDDNDVAHKIYFGLGTAKVNPNYQAPATNSNANNSNNLKGKGEGRNPLHQGELMQLAGSAIAPLYDLGRSFAKPVHEKAINNEYRYQVLDAQRKQRYNPNYKPIIANMAATQNNIRENSSNSQVARANQIAAMNAGNEMLSQEANKELMANQELANRYNNIKMGIGDAEANEQKRIYENNMQHDTLRENMRHNVATQLGALTVDAGKRRTTDAMNQLDYSMLNTIYNNYGTAAYSAVKAGLADGHDLIIFKGNVQQAIEAKKARTQGTQGTQQAPATKVQTSPVTSPNGDVKAGEITTTTITQ